MMQKNNALENGEDRRGSARRGANSDGRGASGGRLPGRSRRFRRDTGQSEGSEASCGGSEGPVGGSGGPGVPLADAEGERRGRIREAVSDFLAGRRGRNLTPYQRAELALKLKPLIAAKAKENIKRGGGSGPSGRQKSDNPTDTKKELAKGGRAAVSVPHSVPHSAGAGAAGRPGAARGQGSSLAMTPRALASAGDGGFDDDGQGSGGDDGHLDDDGQGHDLDQGQDLDGQGDDGQGEHGHLDDSDSHLQAPPHHVEGSTSSGTERTANRQAGPGLRGAAAERGAGESKAPPMSPPRGGVRT